MNLQSIRQQFERKKGRRDQVAKDLKTTISAKDNVEREIGTSEKAQEIIIAVAQATQNELEYRICEPVSLALAAVYDNPYKQHAKFDITGRGTTECNLAFERNGHLIKPLGGCGGGPIDVASFGLRVGSWSLAHPRSRAILCLDEPFKWVQRDKISLCGNMLKEISEQLEFQTIMVSHAPELIEASDKIIWQEINNDISSTKFSGDLKTFVSFLSTEKEQLKEKGKQASKYQKKLYEYFLK